MATSLPPNVTLPPGVTLPPNVTLPPGFSIPPGTTLPPGTTIPPALLNPNAGAESTGAEIPASGAVSLGEFQATPVFEPLPFRIYDKVSATKSMSGIPRFGHSSDFSYLAYIGSATNAKDGEDYLVGLLFAGCFLLVFFLIWTIVLVIFKLTLNGFLCGDPFINPHLDDPASKKAKEDAEADGEEYIEPDGWLKRPRRIRITFFLCGLIQIIFAILLVTKGVSNLQRTTDTVQASTESVRVLVREAEQVSLGLKQVGDTGLILRDQIVFDLDKENFCPANPAFAQTQLGQNMMGAADGAVQILNQLGDFVTNNVVLLEASMADAEKNIDSLDQSVADAESYEWLGGLVAFPYLILASLMMVGAFAAQLNTMTDCFLCVLNWLVLPLYIFVTIFSYLALGIFAIGASLNADFCGGQTSSPDQVLVDFMFRAGFDTEGFLFQVVRYYAYQCTIRAEVDPFVFLRSFDGAIVQGRVVVQNLTQSMDDISLQQLSLGCNRDFRPLHRSLGQMLGVLDALLQAANRAISLLRCRNIVPIYTTIVYDATCSYSVSGFAWIFSCLLIVSIMGMILIMFRASYQNTVFEKPPEIEWENSSIPFHTRQTQPEKGQKGDDNEDKWNDEEH